MKALVGHTTPEYSHTSSVTANLRTKATSCTNAGAIQISRNLNVFVGRKIIYQPKCEIPIFNWKLLKIPCIKVPKSPQKTRAQLWEWSRIVPCVETSILCEKNFKNLEKPKMQLFCILTQGQKHAKGGTLEEKKLKVFGIAPNFQEWWGA